MDRHNSLFACFVCVTHKGKKMESQQVDTKLLALLKDLPYFSRLGTCLSIRLADHAAQLCGYRSTRQVDDSHFDDVSDQFDILINNLYTQISECVLYIKEPHVYKSVILGMNDLDIELLLEDVLFEMTHLDNRFIFTEQFFES